MTARIQQPTTRRHPYKTMKDIAIATGGQAIDLATIDPKVRLNKYTDSPGEPLDDITPLEAIAYSRQGQEAAIYATVPENYAETSWTEHCQCPVTKNPISRGTWTVFLTDFTTVIEKDGVTNAYVYDLKHNKHTLVFSRIEPFVGSNAEHLRKGINWAINTRKQAVAQGLLMSEWIASQISKWKERTA